MLSSRKLVIGWPNPGTLNVYFISSLMSFMLIGVLQVLKWPTSSGYYFTASGSHSIHPNFVFLPLQRVWIPHLKGGSSCKSFLAVIILHLLKPHKSVLSQAHTLFFNLFRKPLNSSPRQYSLIR